MSQTISQPATGAGTLDRAVIFESYGWRDAGEIATRLRQSLEQAGFEVWIDREHIKTDALDFWSPLQQALEQCKLVVALLSPHSVRAEAADAKDVSVCHNELVMAVRMKKAVVSVIVVDCEPPLAINLYEPIRFTDWSQSPTAYDHGVQEILHWVREGLADHRRYCIYVDNLSRDRLTFAEEQTAALDFAGRDWLLRDVGAWLDGDQACLLIEAEPGSGKTALVAELLRRNPGDRILAYHFCNARREDTVDARRFVRSLAAMLCGALPGYRTLLRGSEDLVRSLHAEPRSMLWDGVLQPLRALPPPAAPRYIVVDGLDEAMEAGAAMTIPQLLAGMLDECPPWLKVMVTTRPHDRVLALFQAARRCALDDFADDQRLDVQRYIDARLAEPKLAALTAGDAAARGRAMAAIAAQSAGNFKFAEMVLDELAQGTLALGALEGLPKSLAGLYYNRADARFPDGTGYDKARRVLAVLVAARQAMTRAQLAMITGLEPDDLLGVLRDLLCFVAWDPDVGDGGAYRIAHKSIADWLLAPPGGFDRFKVDPASGRDLILAHCRKWHEHHEIYALTHVISHLLDAGAWAEALDLIRGGFLVQRRRLSDTHRDFEDVRGLTTMLAAAEQEAALVDLAQTDNIAQRDGVAAGLQAAPAAADAFVERVVDALLQVH